MDVRCGRIIVDGRMMTPDQRKGKLRVCKDTDGLTHLQFGLRSDDLPYVPEDDFLIFPQECEMKFIPKPGCFVIKFPDDASRNMFFWSQELTGTIADEKLTADLNVALNGSRPGGGGGEDDLAGFEDEQEQLLAMLDAGGGDGDDAGDVISRRAAAIRQAQAAAASALAEAPPAGDVAPTPVAGAAAPAPTPVAPTKADAPPSTTPGSATAVTSDALRSAFGATQTPEGSSGGGNVTPSGNIDAAAMAAALAGLQRGRAPAGPGLSDILTAENVGEMLRNDDVHARLAEHLPDEHKSSQDLEELLRTPQFQNQLERFSAALQSGQMDLSQFGLDPGTGFSVVDFLTAIKNEVEKSDGKKTDGAGNDAMKE